MSASESSPLDVHRGLRAGAIATGGAVLAALMMCAVMHLTMWICTGDPMQQNAGYCLAHVLATLVPAAAAAAFATYAPDGKHPFLPTFATVFVIGLFGVVFLAMLSPIPLSPQYTKGIDHPPIYPSEIVLLALPPLTIGAWITLDRRFRFGFQARD